MCAGIAVCRSEFPDEFVARHGLESRIVTRGAGPEREVRFLFLDARPVLPVWIGNVLSVVEWGNPSKAPRLPRTGLCPQEKLSEWSHLQPEQVTIPANYGLERGVWYQVVEGMQGVLIHDAAGTPHVYMLTMPSTHYYQVMTRNTRMPVLVGQVI